MSLKNRYHRGKEAFKKIAELDEFVKLAPQEQEASYSPPRQPIPDLVPEYIPSESRSSELEEILEALKDPNVRMIGIYGMGGVGKTTLVHQVKLEAQKSDSKFDAAVVITVKPDPDLSKIREEIAEKLGLVYKREYTEEKRRELLWDQLKNKSTALLILDDLWGKFDYHTVGIPFGEHHQGCKLLLTSRSLGVLRATGSKRNIQLGLLKDPEDWQLFERTVGSFVNENDELHSKAMDIVKACSGLPLSIVTMAGTLRDRSDLFEWEDALRRLRNLMHTEIGPEEIKEDDTNDDIEKVAYSTIKLSFQKLEGHELKLFFLICATTADAISTRALLIEDLIRYAKGWGFLRGIETMQQARNRVSCLIRRLKDCCLLIENDNQQQYSVHDLVRDVGILIARQDWKMLMARDVEDEKLLGECTSMFLQKIDFSGLPEHLNCPQLGFFHLRPKPKCPVVPDTFFRDMCNLRVLFLTRMQFSQQLPSSIEFLKELRTLCLHHCVLENISTIGELTKLEILSLSDSEITQLPKELGKLIQLRLLDLRDCYDLELIPVDTISSLRKLEELYILNSFKKWEEDQNASLSELKDLRQLKALEIRVPTAKILPSNFFSMELQQCKILIGVNWRTWDLEDESKVLKIEYETNDDAIKQFGATKLLEEVEVLFLKNLSGVSSICNGVAREGFSQLKKLRVENSPDVQFIIEAMKKVPTLEILKLKNLPKLERIYDGQRMEHAFQNLKKIHVDRCPQLLERSFPVSSMVKLQTIFIRCCPLQYLAKQEEAMADDVGYNDSTMIEFSELCSLTLDDLREMINFSIQAKQNPESNPCLAFFNKVSFPKLGTLDLARIRCPTLETLVSDAVAVEKEIGGTESTRERPSCLFGEKVSFPLLESLRFNYLDNFKTIWPNPLVADTFCKLQILKIENCKNLQSVIPLNTGISTTLRTLSVMSCDSLTEIFGQRLSRKDASTEEQLIMSSLQDLKIIRCPKLETFVSEEVAVDKNETRGIGPTSSFFSEKVSFPKLATLMLGDICTNRIWGASFGFENLRELKVRRCNNLSYLLTSSMCSHLLHLQNLKIKKCREIEEIFLVDDSGENKNTTIILPQLRCLTLGYLPKAKRFSVGSLVQFPSLEALAIGRTMKLESSASASKAVEGKEIGGRMSVKESPISLFNEKLNCSEVQDQKLQVSFPPLKRLSLRNLDDFETIWHDQLDEKLFCKVEVLEIEGCSNLKSVFPSNMARSFTALEDIRIRKCDSLTEIFEKWPCGEEWGAANLSFNKLKQVMILQCPNLKTVFPASMHKNFKELGVLHIIDCEALEEIIAVDAEGELEITSYFPAAIFVILHSLPKLRYRVTRRGRIIFKNEVSKSGS